MDTIARLKELMQKRGISLYRLAKRGSLNYSTLKYDVRYNHPLSVDTIGQICKTLGIPLYPDDRDDVRNPSGLYRIWSLIVPNSNHAITNEIPSTNIVGVLKVASGLTNTVTAVPWTALAGDPAVSTNAAVGAILHVANLSDGDRLLAYDAAASKYWMWERDGETWRKTINVSSVNGMDVAESAQEADEFRLPPGDASPECAKFETLDAVAYRLKLPSPMRDGARYWAVAHGRPRHSVPATGGRAGLRRGGRLW